MPAAYNSKTINDSEMKFGGVVKDYYLINLVWFNWRMTSLLHHNDDVIHCYRCHNCQNFTKQRRKV